MIEQDFHAVSFMSILVNHDNHLNFPNAQDYGSAAQN